MPAAGTSIATLAQSRRIALAAALLLTFAACSSPAEPQAAAEGAPGMVSIVHAQGTTEVPRNPSTVVVLDLTSLSTLDVLSVPVAGVPKQRIRGELAAYSADTYTDVGDTREPDLEAINALEPDLIIVGGRSAAVYPQVSAIAPTIDLTFDSADFLASNARQAELLGEIFDKGPQVEAHLAEIEGLFAELATRGKEAGEGLIVMTSGGELTAFGPGGRFGWIHDEAGVAPAATGFADEAHGEVISFEFVHERDPDILFVIDRDAAAGHEGAAAREVLDNDLVADTTAWRNEAVVYLDPVTWYLIGGGLGAMRSMAVELGAALA